jgi:hypothetical protein
MKKMIILSISIGVICLALINGCASIHDRDESLDARTDRTLKEMGYEYRTAWRYWNE